MGIVWFWRFMQRWNAAVIEVWHVCHFSAQLSIAQWAAKNGPKKIQYFFTALYILTSPALHWHFLVKSIKKFRAAFWTFFEKCCCPLHCGASGVLSLYQPFWP
jgi:hypothetical protein